MLVLTALSEKAEGLDRLAPTANQTPSGNTKHFVNQEQE